MRRIASLRGKIYELIELTPEAVAAISSANGYENPTHFIARHENWQSTVTDALRIHDSTPVRPPKFKSKPIMQAITSKPLRGRPPKPKDGPGSQLPKKRKKRRSKYGFEKIRVKGDSIFVQGEAYRVAAAAAYFGSKYVPARKYSVHKAKLGGVSGSRVEWVR